MGKTPLSVRASSGSSAVVAEDQVDQVGAVMAQHALNRGGDVPRLFQPLGRTAHGLGHQVEADLRRNQLEGFQIGELLDVELSPVFGDVELQQQEGAIVADDELGGNIVVS